MSRRFQFSLERLLSTIALFALALCLLRVGLDSPESALAAIPAFPVALAAAVGRLFGRAGVWSVSVLVTYCLLVYLTLRALLAFVTFVATTCLAAVPMAKVSRFMWNRFTEGAPPRHC
ncbi:MAG TPA: hypothetical protein VG826_25885 [Pirellulales bacterium]|nr:hypothetical protein [Pirellulales bacterium]